MLHADHSHIVVLLLVLVNYIDSCIIVRNQLRDHLCCISRNLDAAEEFLDLCLYVINIYITYYDDSLVVRTIPFAIVSTESFRIATINDTHQTDWHTITVLAARIESRERTLQHTLLTYHSHTILIVNDITLTLYRLLRQRDTITPILENQHAGIDSGGTGSRNIREIIYRLVDASVGIQVLAILHADALEIVLETVSLEMFGAIESQVLQEVSQTTLVVILIDGTHLLCNVETSYMLREIVVTNVIGQAIVEVTDSHILVNRYLWHLLCHHTTCSKQHHRCYENLL